MNGTVTLDGVVLKIKTEYPYGERVEITVETDIEEPFSIGVRIPTFTDGVTVNGKAAAADGYGYHVTTKVWRTGDKIELVIPKILTTTVLNGKIALTSGIVVMALDERVEDLDVKITERIVNLERIDAPFDTREAYLVTIDNGASAKFVDFASAGWDWSAQKNRITVWVDKA